MPERDPERRYTGSEPVAEVRLLCKRQLRRHGIRFQSPAAAAAAAAASFSCDGSGDVNGGSCNGDLAERAERQMSKSFALFVQQGWITQICA
jgi:hypothetical protein